MTVRPRDTVHRGSVEAVGVVVSAAWIGEAAARARVVALWQAGTVVTAVEQGAWLVRWPLPRRLRCAAAPGLPVTRAGAALTTAPLADDELAALAAPAGSLVQVRAGVCELVAPGREVDVAAWLDVDGFEVVDAAALGEAPAPAVVVAGPGPAAVRSLFAGVVGPPPADAREAREALLAALRDGAAGQGEVRRGGRARPWAVAGLVAGAVVGLLGAPLAAAWSVVAAVVAVPLLALGYFARRKPGGSGGPVGRAAPAPSRPPLPRPRPPAPSRSRLREALARLLAATGLMRALARRHEDYLQRLLAMFERGDLGEALRHAIPLGSGGGGPTTPVLGSPAARDELRIAPTSAPATRSLQIAGAGFERLRRVYRAGFERLVAEGRVDEAAFVLAELLHADEEAVAFLERHDRRLLAAEIAAARGLAPGLVVRQWFLAGEHARAVAHARRHGAFADAVARLERDPDRRDEAAALRLLWAGTLADAGDYALAVQVVGAAPAAAPRVRVWLDAAIALEGPLGARMLGLKLSRFPDSLAEHSDLLARLTDPEDADQAELRAELQAGLLRSPASPAVVAAVRPLLRGLVADGARGAPVAPQQLLETLKQLGDDALRVDLPGWPEPPRPPALSGRDPPLEHRVAAADVGAVRVHDAALLPDGKLLVALGELGVRLLARDGRVVWSADQPATSLVVSDHGDRAIAVVARGPDVVRLARLDLGRRRAVAWCEAPLARWAATFDGDGWLVAEHGRVALVVVDALADDYRALDRRELDGTAVLALARGPQVAIAAVRQRDGSLERWRWELPGWALRSRAVVTPATSRGGSGFEAVAYAESARGHAGLYDMRPPDVDDMIVLGPPVLVVVCGERRTELDCAPGLPRQVAIDEAWVAVATADAAGVELRLIDLAQEKPRLVVALAGAREAALRLAAGHLVLADDRGRVLALDLRDGQRVRDVRVL